MIDSKIEMVSRFDSEKKYSNTHYAVTLTSTAVGHAQIVVEGINEDHPFCYYAHLARPFKIPLDNFGTVKKFNTHNFNDNKFKYIQSVTWLRPKEKVEAMVNKVNDGADKEKFSLWGRFYKQEKVHNCITWAMEKLEFAEIYVNEENKNGILNIKKNPKI